MLLSPRIGLWITAVAALIGLFAGLSGQGHWQQWMLFMNGGTFGVKDPQFGTDVGFYVFDYPFWRYLLDVGFTATALSVLGALAMHYVYGGVRLQGVGDRMSVGARAHLTALVGAVRAAEGRGVLPGQAGAAAGVQLRYGPVGRGLHRHQRGAAGEGDPDLHLDRGRDRDPDLLQHRHAQHGLGRRLARPARHRGGGDRRDLPDRGPAVHGEAEHPRQGSAPTSSTRSTTPAGRTGSRRSNGRSTPPRPRSRRTSLSEGQDHRAHDPPARPGRGQRDVHAVPADPLVLRLPREARRRPLQHRRPAAGLRGRRPRDQLLEADRAADQLAEQAHRLHPRLRVRGRAGEHDL